MTHRLGIILLAALLVLVPISGCSKVQQETLTVFAGSASKPPLDEAGRAFEEETGTKVYFIYGGSGTVLSQMKLSKTGDLYIPGSPDFMAKAERDGMIVPDSVKVISYLVPVIAVQKGNPRSIRTLSDLARPGIKVGIANPETVCVGLYAVEILSYNNLLNDVGKNVVTYAGSCDATATLVALKAVDAVMGWDVFGSWNPDTIDVVYLKPEQIPRLAYIPGAISTFARDRAVAQRFLDFLISPKGQDIFRKWGYNTTESEARRFAPGARVGGEYRLPPDYKPLVK